MSTHQQPSSKEWEEEFEQLYNQLYQPLGVDGQHVARKMQIRTFIQSLLTSHSEAIRERVEGMRTGAKYPDFDGGYDTALDDILALLNDSDGEKKYTDEEMVEMERNVGRMSY